MNKFLAFKASASLLGVIYKTIRLSSTLAFASAAFAGVVLAGSLIGHRVIWLLIFSMSSAIFGFVVNDLLDAKLDKSAGATRNPVSTGQLSRRGTIIIALLFLLASLATLPFLSLQNQILGLVVIFLYFTYSGLIRAKARPVLDIVYHGLCLAILAIMGYTVYRPFNVVTLSFASIVFLLSSMSEILQEVRDYETDRGMIMNTVLLLGKRRSLILCLMLFLSTFPFLFLIILKGVVSPMMFVLSPLTYFILAPIVRAITNEEYEGKMLRAISQRRLFLIALLIVALIFLKTPRPLIHPTTQVVGFLGS